MSTTFPSGFAPPVHLPTLSASVPAPVLSPPVPAGTFVPGTKVQVGGHRVVIEKYLSEGGFAHVYLVRLPKAVDGVDKAVLKRVAVPDKEALTSMRTEVETMKKLKGRRHIVTYIDSHASQLKAGGYEVFLLMEYCNGGGLIDFMNTRLQNRLTEPEILNIFSDVAQGVANMHYLKPPLLHRDLKVENVLITSSESLQRYKLCDFGSAAAPRLAATNAAEGRLIEDDVQKHTTLQYRSPEMIDVYRKQPINEKSDIWALGVLLYKLCYYKTPFEEQGQMAILNASFKFPGYPRFSDNLKRLIALMLREDPRMRPNIYQVLREVCLLRGTDIPIEDIYGGPIRSEARRDKPLPASPNVTSPPTAGVYVAPIVKEKPTIPEIIPMRRGRPNKSELRNETQRPNSSPMRGVQSDPFVALDSNPTSISIINIVDDVSARFPPIDQFSILSDATANFAFDLDPETNTKASKDISQRVTDALADDAFARPSKASEAGPPLSKHTQSILPSQKVKKDGTDSSTAMSTRLETGPIDMPQRAAMVSVGTMTSPSPPSNDNPNVSAPHPHIALPSSEQELLSQLQVLETSRSAPGTLKPFQSSTTTPRFLDQRSKSHTSSLEVSRSPGSSRPSLEGQRPSKLDFEGTINRSKSASSRSRPSSVYAQSKNAFSHDQKRVFEETKKSQTSLQTHEAAYLRSNSAEESESTIDASKISSNVDFLRAMEEEDPSRKKEKRLSGSSKHIKRASMPSISLSSTKSLLAGRFGDAFRRFEANIGGSSQRASSPSSDHRERILSPITGSETTDNRSDDGHVFEETEPVPPEIRRELERRRLSQEEKRVAIATAAHRQRISQLHDLTHERSSDVQASSRAASIQSKVKTLLDQNGSESPVKTEAELLRYSQQPSRENQISYFPIEQPLQMATPRLKNPSPYKPPHDLSTTSQASPQLTSKTRHVPFANSSNPLSSATISTDRPISRPSAPPKPQALRTSTREPNQVSSSPSVKPSPLGNQISVTTPSSSGRPASRRAEAVISPPSDDWEEKFTKKYPSLAGLEMVERDIDLAR